MRIAFAGCSCSGKTTTAEIISKKFDLTLIPEVESTLLTSWKNLGILSDKNLHTPTLSMLFHEAALSKRECDSKINNSITDRTALELFVYFEKYTRKHVPYEYACQYLSRCLMVMNTYECIFMFPSGVLKLEDNKMRTVDTNYQIENYQAIINLFDSNKINYVLLEKASLTLNQRVEEVSSWIR